MKRIFASLLLAAALLVSAAASASSADLAAMTTDELHALSNDIVAELAARQGGAAATLGPYTVEIRSAEIMEDDDGGDCLVVTFVWSHQKEETQTFFWSFNYYAYQDGIEITTPDAYISVPYDTQDTRVKAGATLETQIAFALRNTTSPVEIELSEYLGETDTVLTRAFDLSALDGEVAVRPAEPETPAPQTSGGLTVIGKPQR